MDRQTTQAPQVASVSLLQIFLLFSRIGITSFGGGLTGWIFREVVDRRRWLREDEFLSSLTLSQILPGANVINISVYIGQKLQGWMGSVVAVLALLLPPMAIGLGLLALVKGLGDLGWVHNFLEGVAAAAIGMTFSVAYRAAQHATKRSRWAPLIIILVFVAVGVLRWPLIPVVLGGGPVAVLLARRTA